MGFRENKMFDYIKLDSLKDNTGKEIEEVTSDDINIQISGLPIPVEELIDYFIGLSKGQYLPEKYIINENVCVCIWQDGTKTVSKKKENDVFDKELGFLFCCYQAYYKHLSRNKRSKILDWINYSSMKDFLFEIFKEKNNFTTNEAKRYLADLKVEKRKKGITKIESDKVEPNQEVERLENKIKDLIEENKKLKEEKESHQKCGRTRKPKHAMEN